MKDTNSTFNYLVSRHIADYWSWWTEELTSFLPMPIKQILFNSNKLILEIDGNFVDLHKVTGNNQTHIVRAPITELTSKQVEDVVKDTDVTERILTIPNHQVLEKNVSFPMPAEENIREVLSYEMDRLTPFTASQVYYDYFLISRNKQKNLIDLKLVVVPKDRVDGLLQTLNQIGFMPHVVSVHGGDFDKYSQINLLPIEKRAKKINALKIVNYTLTGVLILLLLVSLLLPVWSKVKYIENLEPELNVYSKSAESITILRKQVDKAEEEALFLVDKKNASILILQIIDELTQIIPDDTWVNQVDVSDSEVHIYGESISSASLLPIIEASKIFSNAQFRSPVTQNRQNNTERFHLSAQIKQEENL